jgi:hypothetical protein
MSRALSCSAAPESVTRTVSEVAYSRLRSPRLVVTVYTPSCALLALSSVTSYEEI